MELNSLANLPFYGLNNSEFSSFLRLDKYDILGFNSGLCDYIQGLDANRGLNSINSGYVTDVQFNNLTQKVLKDIELAVFHLNIRSLNCNHRALVYFLEMLVVKFDVFILSEVWDINIDFYHNILDGYTFYYEVPKDSHVGGIGMYIKNSFTHQECQEFKLVSSVQNRNENIWYEISANGNKYIIGAIYRHPNQNIKHFSLEMERVLGKLSDQSVPCIIAGDINIDLTKCTNNQEITDYVDNLLINNFLPVTVLPTRITTRSATLIDHLYYYEGTRHRETFVKSANCLEDITDHLPNIMVLINNKRHAKPERPLIRLFSENNLALFKHELQNADWSSVNYASDVNESYGNFISIFTKFYNKCFPLTKLSRKRAKDKPWITYALRRCSQKKNSLYKKWIKTRDLCDERKYKSYKKVFAKAVQGAELVYYKELFDLKTNSAKKLWSNLNKVCSFKKSKSSMSTIQKLIINNTEIIDNREICNELNKYFATVGMNLVTTLHNSNPTLPTDSFKKYCDPPVMNSMFCFPVDRYELIKLIRDLKPKSPGPDGIRPKLIRNIADEIVDPLLYIFNLSISTGQVADDLKLAKVVPLYKKGEKYLPGNYRPISLLNVFDKLLERIMYNRLYRHLQVNNVLYEYQFGFRKNFSTILALLDVTDSIYENIDDGNSGVGIYVDLQKAFDTVNHDILLYKLFNYGIRGVVHDWFVSYLSRRQQFVQVDTVMSSIAKITCGVPQGSVLGPLLFLIYVNDIGNAVPKHKVKLFADDTNIFIFSNGLADLEMKSTNCINALNNWFLSNKLTLNLSKTCYMTFCHNQLTNLNVSVNGQRIEKVTSCKYLGILLDNETKWIHHVNSVYSKLIKFTSIFHKLRDKLPKPILRQIYFTFVYPHILYGIELYANTYSKYLDKLTVLNNKLLRTLQNKPIITPVQELYFEYNVLPIPQLHEFQLILFVHKFLHHPQLLPDVFHKNRYFVLNEQIHVHNTRNKSKIHIRSYSTSRGQRNVKYKAAFLWNNLPQALQETSSTHSFKRQLKCHLLSHSF